MLLVAAPRGGEAIVKVIEQILLCYATDELLEAGGSAPGTSREG